MALGSAANYAVLNIELFLYILLELAASVKNVSFP